MHEPVTSPQALTLGEPPKFAVVRALSEADLDSLVLGAQAPPRIAQITSAHHQIARLCAQNLSAVEVSAISGYTPQYVRGLSDDPAFRELVAYYTSQREEIKVDVLERMKSLGLATLQELVQRLESEPDKFANRELMELAELMLVKPATTAAKVASGMLGGQSPAGGLNINVKFVQAPTIAPQASSPAVVEARAEAIDLQEID